MSTESNTSDERAPEVASRRSLLRNAAVIAGGAVAAGMATAEPAAANDPNDVTLGENKTTAGATQANSTGTSSSAAFLFQAGTVWGAGSAAFPCALAGWSEVPERPTGVYAYTGVPGGDAMVGSGVGTGAFLHGGRANARLSPSGAAAPSRGDQHLRGDLVADGSGNLWYCTATGTPGQFRKLAGPATAGSFHPLTPGRVYDSRVSVPGPAGPLGGAGGHRTISVADSRNPANGAVVSANFVPAGATAVFCNLTIVSQTGSGYLLLNPGGTTTIGASTINWTDPGQVVANGVVATLNANRQITVVSGTGGSAHFLVDVTGYYL
jgi:hypothetical protein